MSQKLIQNETNISSRNLFLLSVGSALLYGLFGLAIFEYALDYPPVRAFTHGVSIEIQLLNGLVAGIICTVIIAFFLKQSPIKEVLDEFSVIRILSNMELAWYDRLQISFFAGVGEEFLFRGAMQPWLGIWLTSFIFVALHGYFKFKSLGHILFGIMFFTLSMGLGLLYEYMGLFASMATHFTYDVLMLSWIQKKPVIENDRL